MSQQLEKPVKMSLTLTVEREMQRRQKIEAARGKILALAAQEYDVMEALRRIRSEHFAVANELLELTVDN
jgi:hypothetical protein